MLRSALASSGGGIGGSSRGGQGAPVTLPDLPQLLQQRNQALEARRRERADMQVSSARAELVGAVLGSWSKAPKGAREDMERYLQGEDLQRAMSICRGQGGATGAASDARAAVLVPPCTRADGAALSAAQTKPGIV